MKDSQLPPADTIRPNTVLRVVEMDAGGTTVIGSRKTTAEELKAGMEIAADDITDATTPGKALLTAADAGAQREALGLGASGCSVVFEGDSITAGYSVTHPFSYYCANELWFQGATIYNVAVASSTISSVASRYTANVYPHRPAANGGDGGARAYLVLMIGVNDIGGGASSSSMISALTDYCEQAIADGFTMILGTPTAYYGWTSAKFAVWNAFRTAIIVGVIPRDLPWDAVQFAPQSDDSNWYTDGLHWNENFHKVIAKYLAAGLLAGFPNVKPPVYLDYETQRMLSAMYITFASGDMTVSTYNGGQRITNASGSEERQVYTSRVYAGAGQFASRNGNPVENNPLNSTFQWVPANLEWQFWLSDFSSLVTLRFKDAIMAQQTPSSSTATGIAGQIKVDDEYIYVCTATNVWKRVELVAF